MMRSMATVFVISSQSIVTMWSCTLIMRYGPNVLDRCLLYYFVAMVSAVETDKACRGVLSRNTYELGVERDVLQTN